MFANWTTTHSEYDKFISKSGSFVEWIHISRAIVAILACVPNAFLIFLYWKASKRRPSSVKNRINYALMNLLVSNLGYGCILCVHSILKLIYNRELIRTGSCLTLTWFTVFASFEPIWAMGMIALARLVYFARIDRLDRFFDTNRMLIVRGSILALNILSASLIIAEEVDFVEDTHCNYQLMLDNSRIYLAYSALITLYLGVTGIVSFVFRTLLRRHLIRQIYASQTTSTTVAQQIADVTQPKNMIHQCQFDPPTVPALIWEKPKLILIALVVLILFFAPRVAFYSGSPPFWLITTICPALMTFLLPLFFLWTTKEFRIEFRILFKSSKRPDVEKRKVQGV